MRRYSRRWVASWFVVALTVGGQAAAAPELTWQAPKECPQGAAVLALVRDIVGEKVWRGATLRASGRIVETTNGYRLDLRMESPRESPVRTLDAKVCGDLLGASAVVLGLNLKSASNADGEVPSDGITPAEGQPAASGAMEGEKPTATTPETPTTGPASSPQPASTAPAKTQPPPNGEPPAAVARNDESEDRFWIGLPQVAVGVGSLPRTTWSGGATFGVRFSEWATWLSGRYQLPQRLEPEWSTEVGAEIRRYSGEVGVSRGWRAGVLEFGPVAFVGVDYLTARGTGADVVSALAESWVVSVGAGVFARVALGGLVSLSGTLCGELPSSRPRFVVESLGEMGQLGPAQGRFVVGTDWNF